MNVIVVHTLFDNITYKPKENIFNFWNKIIVWLLTFFLIKTRTTKDKRQNLHVGINLDKIELED